MILPNFRTLYPDFDLSRQRHGFSAGRFQSHYGGLDPHNLPKYVSDFFSLKQIYDNDRIKSPSSTAYKIPPIIHQIWLGSPMPEKYKTLTHAWQAFKGWEYKLWTDEEVKTLSLYNEKLYKAAHNYGERSDLLRYEILYRFGGVYVDADVECMNPEYFEFAHREYSFYAGLEPLEWWKPLLIGNALFASTPQNPILHQLITHMQKNWDDFEETKRMPYIEKKIHTTDTLSKTGPFYVTETILNNLALLKNDGIILPPTFFYPILRNEIAHRDAYFFPETAAVHYWVMHWFTEEGKVKEESR